MPFRVEFEQGRLYVEPRQSVLFFAAVGDRRVRCYVTREALVAHFGVRKDLANAYKYCLCAYDRNAETIHETARQLIASGKISADGAVTLTPEAVADHSLVMAA